MEVFKVIYNNENDGDLYGISIVDDPANGFNFIAMNNKVVIKLASDQKKKILYGIVLRPEQKIYREFEDGTPFNLMFDAPTIERFSQDFMMKGYQKNTTFNHESNNWLEGTTIVENWIVMNKDNDKGNVIGLPVEQGDWCIGMKLSDQLWSEYIETGKAKGFSIDSFIQFEKIKMKRSCENCLTQDVEIYSREETNKENMSMLKKLIKMFSEGDVTLASLDTTELGTLTADAFEVGNIVYDSNLSPVVDTEFTADNKVYTTDETGTITEVADVAEEAADVVEEAPVELEEAPAELEEVKEEEVKTEEDVDSLKGEIESLKAEIEKLTTEKEGVLLENVELKKLSTSVKLKAEVKGQSPITMNKKERSTESPFEAISRITKKINN